MYWRRSVIVEPRTDDSKYYYHDKIIRSLMQLVFSIDVLVVISNPFYVANGMVFH